MITHRMNGACTPTTRNGRTEIDRALNHLFGGFPSLANYAPATAAAPPINVWEDDASVFVEAELPGYSMGNVEVLFEDGSLTIQGRRDTQAESKGETFIHRERAAGEFSRLVVLDAEVNAEAVSAMLKDGVLLVTLPKTEASKPRKIEVRGS